MQAQKQTTPGSTAANPVEVEESTARAIVNLLLAAGVPIDAEDDYGDTARKHFLWPDGRPSPYAEILREYGAR